MRIRLISDLHVDWDDDGGMALALNLRTDDVDVLVIAGDVANNQHAAFWLTAFDKIAKCPVLYVPGNHEFWDSSLSGITALLEKAAEGWKNIRLMNRRVLEIAGQRFVGTGVMWYPPGNGAFADFYYIQDHAKTLPAEYDATDNFLRENLKPGDIVISHLIPHRAGIHEKWRAVSSNRFFCLDQSVLIEERKPKAWFFGHTHEIIREQVGDTLLVCNPRGYPGEQPNFDPNLVIEL